MAVEHYSLAISWRYPSYWTILINWIFISAKLINCYDKWFEGHTCRPPSTLLLNIFFFQPERWLSFISVICLWNKTQDSLNAADDGLVCGLTEYRTMPRYFRGKYSLPTALLASCKRNSRCQWRDEGGTLTGSWRRWSLGKLYEEQPESDSHSGPWRERDEKEKERDIRICLKPLHISHLEEDGRFAGSLKSETKLFYWP